VASYPIPRKLFRDMLANVCSSVECRHSSSRWHVR